jgi:hypothetical protein
VCLDKPASLAAKRLPELRGPLGSGNRVHPSCKKRVPLPADWAEIEKADKMARPAAGLDNDQATKVHVSLNLVNQRILAMQLAAE